MEKIRISPITDRDILEKIDEINNKIEKNKRYLSTIEHRISSISFILWIFFSATLGIASMFSSFIGKQFYSIIFIAIAIIILTGTTIYFIIKK